MILAQPAACFLPWACQVPNPLTEPSAASSGQVLIAVGPRTYHMRAVPASGGTLYEQTRAQGYDVTIRIAGYAELLRLRRPTRRRFYRWSFAVAAKLRERLAAGRLPPACRSTSPYFAASG